MKIDPKTILGLLIIIVLGSGAYFFILQRQSPATPPLSTSITNFEECAAAAGGRVLESYPRQCVTADGRHFVEQIPGQDYSDKIQVTTPAANQTIASPVTIQGKARGTWFFEGSFPITLVDPQGKVLGKGFAEAGGEWMTTEFVPFSALVSFTVASTTANGEIILQKDDPSDRPENSDEIRIPVLFGDAPTDTTVKVYFNTPEVGADPDFDCTTVYPITRIIPSTEAIARAALEELLKGPSIEDQRRGFTTSINAGVKIQRLTIVDGTAKVDLSSQIEQAVGGSCRVAAIRAQITQTLLQFPTVQSVVISIDGRTQDILQP